MVKQYFFAGNNSALEQIAQNTQDIEYLKQYLIEVYTTTFDLSPVGGSHIVPIAEIIPVPAADTINDFILDTNGFVGRIEAVTESGATVRTVADTRGVDGAKGETGAQGERGIGIQLVAVGTPTIQGEYTITPLTITFTDGQRQNISLTAKNGAQGIQGEQGARGFTGTGISHITAGTPTQANGNTITPLTFTYSDGTDQIINVYAANGVVTEAQYNELVSELNTQSADISSLEADLTDLTTKVDNLPTGGGTQLYKHTISNLFTFASSATMVVITPTAFPITNVALLRNEINQNCIRAYGGDAFIGDAIRVDTYNNAPWLFTLVSDVNNGLLMFNHEPLKSADTVYIDTITPL